MKPPVSSFQSKVQLFWLHRGCPLLRRLFRVIIREVCSYFSEAPFLVYVETEYLYAFDLMTKSWSRAELTTPIQCSSRYVCLDPSRVLCCGGTDAQGGSVKGACIVRTSGGVEVIAEMRKSRCSCSEAGSSKQERRRCWLAARVCRRGTGTNSPK